jgi:hypothetical protein
MKVRKEIYWDEYITDNNDAIKTLTDRKTKSSDIDQIRNIKNLIDFIHRDLLMKNKQKKNVHSIDFKMIYLNYRALDFNKKYEVMKDSYDLMKSLLKNTF